MSFASFKQFYPNYIPSQLYTLSGNNNETVKIAFGIKGLIRII